MAILCSDPQVGEGRLCSKFCLLCYTQVLKKLTHTHTLQHSLVLHSEYLPVELWYLIKAVPVDDGVDQEKPFACVHVLFSHGTEFLLSSRVPYFCKPTSSSLL